GRRLLLPPRRDRGTAPPRVRPGRARRMAGQPRRHRVREALQQLHAVVPGGGSVQLGQLIDEHGAALLHDLQGLGVDLRDLWRPGSTLTPRYVLWLTEQLPDTSAFVASCRGGRQ